jgi:hypothetical protein
MAGGTGEKAVDEMMKYDFDNGFFGGPRDADGTLQM